MKRRMLSLIVTVAMVLGLAVTMAFAQDGTETQTVATVGEKAYTTLAQAVAEAGEDDTVVLTHDATLTEKLTINKDVTIQGNGNTIFGQPDNKGVYIEVTDGTFALSNVTLKDFGGTVSGASGEAVIKVPATAAAGTVVKATNVNVSNFSRSAYDIRSGSFVITGGSIDCTNGVTGGSNSKLTKGILVGLGSNKVIGSITGVNVTMSASNYADWNTAAIEVYNNANVTINGCSISNVENGIHVDNYYGSAGQDVSVTVSDTTVTATGDAVKLYSTYNGRGGVANASLTVASGTYTGDVRIVGATSQDTLALTGGTYYVADESQLNNVLAYAADSSALSVILTQDITLTQKLTIDKSVSIQGDNHAIKGQADDKSVYIEVAGGTLSISDVTLKDFGGAVSGASGEAVIKVPATAAADTVVNATNVNVSNFSRSAYDIRSGSFAITGGSIDCTNGVTGESNSKLTKGILVGLGSNKVNGSITGVNVTMSASNYADWNTAAIEVYNNANVTIDGCSISNVENGIHVDNYYGSAGQDVSVTVSDTTVNATGDAVKLYSTYNGKGGVANASLSVFSGTYTGKVRIVGATDKDTLSISGGTYSVDPTAYLADGYAVRSTDGNFVVYKPVTAPVKPVADEDGNAIVTEDDMNNAIFSAVAEGKPQVTVDVQTASGTEKVSVTIPTANLNVLAAEEGATLTITSGVGTVTFDKAALATIAAVEGNQVVLTVAPATGLSNEQQAVVGDNLAVELTLTCGDTVISQFNGVATVSLPFALADGKDASDVVVYYVDDAGKLVACDTTYADGVVTFTTTHFSTYMVTYVEEDVQPSEQPSQQPSEQPSEQPSQQPSQTQKPDAEQPQTGDVSNVALWVAMMFVSVATLTGVVAYTKKRA